MKFLLISLFATSLLTFVSELNCMPPKKVCTTIENKIPFVGKEKTISCKYQNGCTSQKIIYRDGSSFKTKSCPGKKK